MAGFVDADMLQARKRITLCTLSARIWVLWEDGSLFVHSRRLAHSQSFLSLLRTTR